MHINTKGEFDHTATDFEQECEDTACRLLNKYLERKSMTEIIQIIIVIGCALTPIVICGVIAALCEE